MESGLASNRTQFKVARTKVRAEIRRAKNQRLAEVDLQDETSHGVSTWLAIRSIQRNFRGLCPMPIAAIRSEDGNLCKSAEEQSERWQRHFTKVLNIESLFDPAVFLHTSDPPPLFRAG